MCLLIINTCITTIPCQWRGPSNPRLFSALAKISYVGKNAKIRQINSGASVLCSLAVRNSSVWDFRSTSFNIALRTIIPLESSRRSYLSYVGDVPFSSLQTAHLIEPVTILYLSIVKKLIDIFAFICSMRYVLSTEMGHS